VIGAEFDPHLHLTPAILTAADAVTIFKEYPHTDIAERAHELFDICAATAHGRCTPVGAMVDTHMLGFFPTQDEPMKSIVASLHVAESKPAILSASIAHGFPWGDVADVGTRVLVYANGDADAAAREATDIAQRLYDARDALLPRYPDIPASLERAATLDGTVVLGDHSDNPGGGAPCDSTFFLSEMLKRGVEDAVIGSFYDPSAAQIVADAGVGARLPLRLGGKIGPSSGNPIDIEVEVAAVRPNHDQDVFGARQTMGLTVWVKHGGIDILINDVRGQVYGLDLFTGIGITLEGRRLIVVKSSNHYVSAYAAIADHLWHVVSPGALSLDLAGVPLTKRDGDYHPRVADPWAIKGKPVPIIFKRERRS
jgi:microcystin degradation protein MlrC